jgi:hypothetical protein
VLAIEYFWRQDGNPFYLLSLSEGDDKSNEIGWRIFVLPVVCLSSTVPVSLRNNAAVVHDEKGNHGKARFTPSSTAKMAATQWILPENTFNEAEAEGNKSNFVIRSHRNGVASMPGCGELGQV